MCGIIGAIAQRNVVPILLEGLRRLEYRGYDSAGLAVVNVGLQRLRSVGRVSVLEDQANKVKAQGHIGIAHTRWATHGAPTEKNAHPHISEDLIAVVHNGIIENHEALRTRLKELGYQLHSDTDTEVIAHLTHYYYQQSKDLVAATRSMTADIRGAYAIGIIAANDPERMVCVRKGSPLIIGVGDNENFIASDVSALLQVTRKVIYLEEGDVADIRLSSYIVYDAKGNRVERVLHISDANAEMAELGSYRHFMQKEIHEQPRALAETLEGRFDGPHIVADIFGAHAGKILKSVNAVTILACGTSYHAGLVARYWIEGLAGIPCSVEVASEYRYRESVPNPAALIVVISQSGETADTIAALAHAQSLGHVHTLCICNVPESSLVRQTKLCFMTHAGPEIGVASTKAFSTQLVALFLLAMQLAKLGGKLSADKETSLCAALLHLPSAIQCVLNLEPQVIVWSQKFGNKHHALFLGRGMHYPIAMEGALKLKEISYIHAEAYPAGELKHGPLALVDKDMPVVAIAPNDVLLEKLKSNLQEVRARGGELYVFADPETHIHEAEGLYVIRMPEHMGYLSPIVHTVPLQLLAYHAAVHKGTDVDKPRNLAKSVTVE